MTITDETIEYVGILAKLELSEEEKLQLQAVMERISLRARVYIEREVGWDS